MPNRPLFPEGNGGVVSLYNLEQKKSDLCTGIIEQINQSGKCPSVADIINIVEECKERSSNKIKEYDIGKALNRVIVVTRSILHSVQHTNRRVSKVPRLLDKYRREHKQGLPHCTRLWKHMMTRMMGYPHEFPRFFFQGNERVFFEKMFECEGVLFRHLYQQLVDQQLVASTDHRNKRPKMNPLCGSSNTVADGIVWNILEFVCDVSLYIPRDALQTDGEHLVKCSFCYHELMSEQIRKTNNPKMRQLWHNMTNVPWEPENIPCTRERKDDNDYSPSSPPYRPSSPAYSPTSPAYVSTQL
jgi:hypothetical protein